MAHLNRRGDLVAGQVRAPWVRRANGQTFDIYPLRATQVYWLDDQTVIGNFQLTDDRWRLCTLLLTSGTPVIVPGFEDIEVRVVRASGQGVWAVDNAGGLTTSWGLFRAGLALCEVGDDGTVYATLKDSSLSLRWFKADGTDGTITDAPISRAAVDTRARDGRVVYQTPGDVFHVSSWIEPFVRRIEHPVVGVPVGLNELVERTIQRLTYRPDTRSSMGFIIATGPAMGYDVDAVKLENGTIRVVYFTGPAQVKERLMVVDLVPPFTDIDDPEIYTDLNTTLPVDDPEDDEPTGAPTVKELLEAYEAADHVRHDTVLHALSDLLAGVDDLKVRVIALERLQRAERPLEVGIKYLGTGQGKLKAQ